MSLADFLLARYEEAEAKARDWWEATEDCPPYTIGGPVPELVSLDSPPWTMTRDDFYARYMQRVEPDPAVIADLQAKRRIIAACTGGLSKSEAMLLADVTLRLLGLPYVAHQDYRPEWRP